MAELCTWTQFSLTDIERLKECSTDRVSLKQAVCEKIGLDDKVLTKQDLIEVDLYIYTVLFGLRQKFSAAQLSTLLCIIKKLHEKCVSTVFDNQSEVLSYFQDLIAQHSVNRPPYSVCIFSPNEVKSINEYVLSTYFKHFKLYKYAFTKKVHLNLFLSYSGEEAPAETESEQEVLSQESKTEQEEAESTSSELPGEKQAEEDTDPMKSRLKELINTGLNNIIQREQVITIIHVLMVC